MNEIENEYVRFWKQEGILYSVFKKPIYAGLEDTKSIIDLRHIISENENQYWVMDMKNLRYVSNEAKMYIDEKGHDFVQACAVVTCSFLNKFMIDIFINMKKSKVPVKSFSTEESAVAWLKEMQNSNNAGINVNIEEKHLS